MRRWLSAAVIVFLLMAGVLWWLRGRGRTHDAAVPTGSVIVALRADGGFEATIERGEPLLFEVFLMGRTATAAATLGSAAAPWHHLVVVRRDPDVALGKPLVLGAPRVMGVVLNGGIPSVLASDDAAIARIAGRQRTYSVALGFPPELTASLPPGRHTFTASLGGVTSSPVYGDRDRTHSRSRAGAAAPIGGVLRARGQVRGEQDARVSRARSAAGRHRGEHRDRRRLARARPAGGGPRRLSQGAGRGPVRPPVLRRTRAALRPHQGGRAPAWRGTALRATFSGLPAAPGRSVGDRRPSARRCPTCGRPET